MLHQPLGRRVRTTRRALGLTQDHVAAQVGVCRATVQRWERGNEAVPAAHLDILAEALGLKAAELKSLHPGSRIRLKMPPGLIRKPKPLEPYPVKGTLTDLANGSSAGFELACEARQRLSEIGQRELDESFPRDSTLELAWACQMIRGGAALCSVSPQEVGCSLYIARGSRVPLSDEYAGHVRRHALYLRREKWTLLAFPQVPVVSRHCKDVFRLDYLVMFLGPTRRRAWLAVELDGKQHSYQLHSDRNRLLYLDLPLLRYRNLDVLNPQYLDRFVKDTHKATFTPA